MNMEEVVQTFIVELNYDTKNSSIAGQALHMIPRLFASEYSHKPLRRHGELIISTGHWDWMSLFRHKDSRFGLLSRAGPPPSTTIKKTSAAAS